MRGQQHKRHLTKLVYDMLPTATYKQKNGGQQTWLPVIYRHCTTQPETFDHLLRCHHPHADTFRSGLIAAITKHCTHRSIPRAFRTTVITLFVDWFIGDDPAAPQPETHHPAHLLLQAQQQIGWDKFLRGFLAKSWETYLADERSKIPHLANTDFHFDHFCSTLIKIMWTDQITTFWLDYQAHIHTEQPTD